MNSGVMLSLSWTDPTVELAINLNPAALGHVLFVEIDWAEEAK